MTGKYFAPSITFEAIKQAKEEILSVSGMKDRPQPENEQFDTMDMFIGHYLFKQFNPAAKTALRATPEQLLAGIEAMTLPAGTFVEATSNHRFAKILDKYVPKAQ
jgi:hypothetical protein